MSYASKNRPHTNFQCSTLCVKFTYGVTDEDESGDDDGELMTRSNLKKQSQSLIDSKNKRRMPKRKGKKK